MAEKRVRTNALSNFTRKYNEFTNLIAKSPPSDLLVKVYTKLDECYEKLETAHDAFIAIADDIDIDNDVAGVKFMEVPAARYARGTS